MAQFNFVQTEISVVIVSEPQVFGDDRGYFMETYQKDLFALPEASTRSLFRTIRAGLHAAYCAICISRKITLKANLCV